MLQLQWKTIWQFLKNLNIVLPYDPAILLLGIYLREMKTCPHKNLFLNLQSSITLDAEKMETMQILIRGWMDKQNEVYLFNGISFNHKIFAPIYAERKRLD